MRHVMPNSEHAIVVEQLCKRYGTLLAVDSVSFTVAKGEVFAFLGPNGAGKSTTAEIIETIRAPTSGKVTVLGMDVTKSKAKVVRRIGVLPQGFSSFDRITVRESLSYYAQVFGCDADVDALMDLTHLRSKADARFNTLSGGLKQRLGIAAALVNDPEVVFLDEPTTGLDPHARHAVWDVLKGLKDRGKTVFLTTHYMEEAELLADTVAIISKGRIVATDSPARLTEKHAESHAAHSGVERRGGAGPDSQNGLRPHADERRKHLRPGQQRRRRARHSRGNRKGRPFPPRHRRAQAEPGRGVPQAHGRASRGRRERGFQMTPRIIAANLVVRLKSFYREKSAMFFTFAFPVILVLVFGTIFTKPEHLDFDLPVQDLSHSAASARLLDALTTDHTFRITPVPAGVDATQYAKEHKQNLVLVIPENFAVLEAKRLGARDASVSVPLTYVHDPSSTAVNTKIQVLDAIVAALNQKMTGTPPFITLVATSILSEQYRFIEFFVPGIIAMAIMTSCLGNALNMNAELRQKGILRKLATTPITRTDWLVSSILYQLILSVVSTVAILLVSYAVFDVRLHIGAWLPLIVVIEVIAFVGIGMLLTPFAKEAESASAVGNAFLFPMMFLSGTFFPVEMMPAFLQSFAKLLPLYYVNEALRAAMIFVDDPATLRLAGVAAGFAAIVFVAGTFKTRWDGET